MPNKVNGMKPLYALEKRSNPYRLLVAGKLTQNEWM